MTTPLGRIQESLESVVRVHLGQVLPGSSGGTDETLGDVHAARLLSIASILSLEDEPDSRRAAYEIATRVVEIFQQKEANAQNRDAVTSFAAAAEIVLTRLGNFPGRDLLRRQWPRSLESLSRNFRIAIEGAVREFDNSVWSYADGGDVAHALTDFQMHLYSAIVQNPSLSVSAPTSAGKSFVLELAVVESVRHALGRSIIYVVPTRALIREVTLAIRKRLRCAGFSDFPIRTVPLPRASGADPEANSEGVLYVLTQERLLSLLHAPGSVPQISDIFVDEAHNIEDGARGVLLQSAVESALAHSPGARLRLASPLTSNPELLLEIFRRPNGRSIVERVSPVSQNVILVTPKRGKPRVASFELIQGQGSISLGDRTLRSAISGSMVAQRASLALEIAKDREPVILFANGPKDAEKLANFLREARQQHDGPNPIDGDVRELVDYVREEVHKDYPLADCLLNGVAYHYGHMPALVRARIEDLFKSGSILYLACTSTLLQGVNLPGRHIIISNPKQGDQDMGRGSFMNLAGRAGRLLQEFHGYVWCLRPGEWNQPVYRGADGHIMRSAVDNAMADGGSIIRRTLADNASNEEAEVGEAVFGKLYCDLVRPGATRDWSRWETQDNAAELSSTADALNALKITLPFSVLDENRGVRPDRLQMLYQHLASVQDLKSLLPLHPNATGSNGRLKVIIQILQSFLGGVENGSYKYYAWLASAWIRATPLRTMIYEKIEFQKRKKEKIVVGDVVRDILRDLENHVRFRLVKFFIAYNSVLKLVLLERGMAEEAILIESIHTYLECGASDRVTLSLMSIGLSRATAIALKGEVHLPTEALSPESCLAALRKADVARLSVPALCVREVRMLLGTI